MNEREEIERLADQISDQRYRPTEVQKDFLVFAKKQGCVVMLGDGRKAKGKTTVNQINIWFTEKKLGHINNKETKNPATIYEYSRFKKQWRWKIPGMPQFQDQPSESEAAYRRNVESLFCEYYFVGREKLDSRITKKVVFP